MTVSFKQLDVISGVTTSTEPHLSLFTMALSIKSRFLKSILFTALLASCGYRQEHRHIRDQLVDSSSLHHRIQVFLPNSCPIQD